MPAQPYVVTMSLRDAPQFDAMLGEVAASVLGHVGYGAEAVRDIMGMFRAALERSPAEGHRECDAKFLAKDGQLTIVVSYAGGREWRTTRPLPQAD